MFCKLSLSSPVNSLEFGRIFVEYLKLCSFQHKIFVDLLQFPEERDIYYFANVFLCTK